MITLNVKESNTFTQDSYNSFLFHLQFHRLSCPCCGHAGCLSVHGYYHRSLKTPDGKIRLRICRVICSCCGHTHALLPSSIVPYSQTSLKDQCSIIDAYESDACTAGVLKSGIPVDESSVRYVIRQYLKHWKQRLLCEQIPRSPLRTLVSRCFSVYMRQFMQIRCTPNILFDDTT